MIQILCGKFTNTVSAAVKAKGCSELALEVSAVSGFQRSAFQVKKKWGAIMSDNKKTAVEQRRSLTQTGGGPVRQDTMEPRVLDILGSDCIKGVAGGMDSADLSISRP